jgi:uncharacterized protein
MINVAFDERGPVPCSYPDSSGVNLLGGRARSRSLHPFSWKELGAHFDLLKALNRGLLPPVYFSDDPDDDLRAYVGTYLKEEITAEGLTRNVPAFARFLEVAAACSGKMFNKTEVANDAKVPRTTVIEYFEILKDTLIGYELPAWNRSQKRKAIETAKFYLFDVGVARALQKLPPLVPRSPDLGDALEHFVFHELRTYIDTRRPGWDLHYWRSTSQFEVDFILNGQTAIEVKATHSVSSTPSSRDEGSAPARDGYAWNPRTLVAMESAEQACTPSPAPLKPGGSGPG